MTFTVGTDRTPVIVASTDLNSVPARASCVSGQPSSCSMRWLRCLAIGMSLVTGALMVAGVVVIVRSPTANDAAFFTGVRRGRGRLDRGGVCRRAAPSAQSGWSAPGLNRATGGVPVTKEVYWRVLDREPQALPVVDDCVIAALRESGVWLLVALGLLLLYFPDGRLPRRRWRWVPIALVADAVALTHVNNLSAERLVHPSLR